MRLIFCTYLVEQVALAPAHIEESGDAVGAEEIESMNHSDPNPMTINHPDVEGVDDVNELGYWLAAEIEPVPVAAVLIPPTATPTQALPSRILFGKGDRVKKRPRRYRNRHEIKLESKRRKHRQRIEAEAFACI